MPGTSPGLVLEIIFPRGFASVVHWRPVIRCRRFTGSSPTTRESKNSFRLWRSPTAIFTRGQLAEQGLQPDSSCVRSRLQVRGREPRGAGRRGEGRGAATRHTHSARFPIQDRGLCVDNSIPVGLGVRPRPRLGGLAVSLARPQHSHPHPHPRPRWLGPLW